ncbi:hypothetical protein VKT23_000018 [Stygiomarasmius scandens]|uniref:Uncharacterized protein n=1 Tax=Marasmiellus scandens TaxID=2682957 RepID=A0ABR1K8Y7_9AGAR
MDLTNLQTEGILIPRNDYWEEFRLAYWGNTRVLDKLRTNRILELPLHASREAFTPVELLAGTSVGVLGGKWSHFVYVRDEYDFVYNRLRDLKELRGGVIVTGNRGIGKSLFNLYGLVRQLINQETTVLQIGLSRPMLFHASGVYELADHLQPRHLLTTPPLWCFHDNYAREDPKLKKPPNVNTALCFVVFTVSSDDQRTASLRAASDPYEILYMNPWNDECERKEFLGLLGKKDLYYDVVGPSMRDIIRSLKLGSTQWFTEKVKEYMDERTNWDQIIQANMTRTRTRTASSLPHLLFAVTRDETQLDCFKADFKSPWVEEYFTAQLPAVARFSSGLSETTLQGKEGTGTHILGTFGDWKRA